MKRLFHTMALAAACLMLPLQFSATAQDYSSPKVTVSKDKVRSGGKIYYSHVVEERQTLFSISKAYSVTVQDIYDANPDLDLQNLGLKKGQIILIPVKGSSTEPAAQAAQPAAEQPKEPVVQQPKGEMAEYVFHKVKWFEDLSSIADKYKVTKKSIMNINGMTSEKLAKKSLIKIPRHPEAWENVMAVAENAGQSTEQAPGKEDVAAENAGAEANTEVAENEEESIFDGLFGKVGKHGANLCIALPFNAQRNSSEQMFDFYCGALLAARNQGKAGIEVNLNVYDAAGGANPVTAERYASSDFCIGPVSNSDISRAVKTSAGKGWIVSPFDQKVEAIADTVANVIQTPTSAKTQIEDMLDWIKSDMRSGDKVILITQKGASTTSYSTALLNAVKFSGIEHSTLSFNVLEGRSIMNSMNAAMNASGANRVIIASDNKPFVMEAVRNLYLVSSSSRKSIELYGTAKLRSFEGTDGIDVESLHAINTHISGGYFIDYESKTVKNFIYQYRALFNAEPTQSAFLGYDILTFFSTAADKYGSRWTKHLGDIEQAGLQSDLKLRKVPGGGYVNRAVRRVTYMPDYSIRLER